MQSLHRRLHRRFGGVHDHRTPSGSHPSVTQPPGQGSSHATSIYESRREGHDTTLAQSSVVHAVKHAITVVGVADLWVQSASSSWAHGRGNEHARTVRCNARDIRQYHRHAVFFVGRLTVLETF